jgi:thiamine biosynthesis protein ThiS
MRLVINGVAEELSVATVAELLASRGLEPRGVVVALNRDCVPRAAIGDTRLHENDEVEILAPMQGG